MNSSIECGCSIQLPPEPQITKSWRKNSLSSNSRKCAIPGQFLNLALRRRTWYRPGTPTSLHFFFTTTESIQQILLCGSLTGIGEHQNCSNIVCEGKGLISVLIYEGIWALSTFSITVRQLRARSAAALLGGGDRRQTWRDPILYFRQQGFVWAADSWKLAKCLQSDLVHKFAVYHVDLLISEW